MRLEDMSFTDYLTAEYYLKERQRKERMKQAEFEKYAKEHNLFIYTTNILEQIRKDILNTFLWEGQTEDTLNSSVRKCLEIIEKYAKQAKGEPNDNT